MNLRAFASWVRGEGDDCSFAPDLEFGSTCCAAHDRHYELHDVSRSEADAELYYCIQAAGYPALAWVYWAGARLFGGFRWSRRGP